MTSVGRYVLQFFSAELGFLVHELCQWHAARVDPQELSFGFTMFEYLRHAIPQECYTDENATAGQHPSPNVCNLISV